MKKALITGITGQDGSYLAEILLGEGYEVYGLMRRCSTLNTQRIEHLKNQIELVEGDLSDLSSLIAVIGSIQPDEVYNLAAQSFVPLSWKQPVMTGDIDGLGVTRVLEAIRIVDDKIRFYQASSSEMFGKVKETPQSERTPFHPRSPYGVAKTYGHYITVNYRESYDIFACSGICFNHESPRRGTEFVTQKIAYGVAKILDGRANELRLGNLDARRDWGYARDYMEAAHAMLQADKPDDYVISTGRTHSVRDFVREAFACVGLDYEEFVKIDSRYMRPAEVDLLMGDSEKIEKNLGWKPKVEFEELVKLMVESALSEFGVEVSVT